MFRCSCRNEINLNQFYGMYPEKKESTESDMGLTSVLRQSLVRHLSYFRGLWKSIHCQHNYHGAVTLVPCAEGTAIVAAVALAAVVAVALPVGVGSAVYCCCCWYC